MIKPPARFQQEILDEYIRTSMAFTNLLDRVEELERRLKEHGWMGEERGVPVDHCPRCEQSAGNCGCKPLTGS